MEQYIDSMNYAEILDSVTAYLEDVNDDTLQFFQGIKEQMVSVLTQIKDYYARRDDHTGREDIFEYVNPDDLPDFYDLSDEDVDRNYAAWDAYTQASSDYGVDTRTLLDVIFHMNKAIDKIGEVE